jgi:hypothetical protein
VEPIPNVDLLVWHVLAVGVNRPKKRRFFMSISKLSLLCGAVLAVGVFAFAADEKAKEFKATCPISGKPALQDKTAAYKDGKVYFCCENCPKAFAGDTAKYATKANQQLVATGQTTQAKCPLSGGKLNPDAVVEVGGAKVGFCCNMCKGKVEAAKGDAQAELVFSDTAFAKAFEVKKAK